MRYWLCLIMLSGLLAACAPGATPAALTPSVAAATVTLNAGPTAGLSPAAPSTADVEATPAAGGDHTVAVVVERSGGITASDQIWTIYTDGTLTLADGLGAETQAAGEVTAEQVSALVAGLDALGFFEFNDVYGDDNLCPDCYRYALTVSDGTRTKTVYTRDSAGDAPPEVGQALELIYGLVNAPQ